MSNKTDWGIMAATEHSKEDEFWSTVQQLSLYKIGEYSIFVRYFMWYKLYDLYRSIYNLDLYDYFGKITLNATS